MSENTIPIPARLKNVSEGGHVAGAVDIIDDVKNKTQDAINVEVDNTLTLHQSEINALDSQNYVTVDTYSDLPATGSVDTVYRVCNWDGSANSGEGAVDATVYSEYAWDDTGSDYKLLDVKTAIGEVFDISLYNAVGGVLATYADLSAALGVDGANVPSGVRKGGMSVKYVHSIDNKYVQYRLMADTFSTTESDWQGVDEEPTAGSVNLVQSGGVARLQQKVDGLDNKTNLTKVKINSKNLYSDDLLDDGNGYKSTGEEWGYHSGWVGKYAIITIPWGDATQITSNVFATANEGFYYVQKKFDGTIISVSSSATKTTTITKEAGAEVLSCTLSIQYNPTDAQIEYGASLSLYSQYNPIYGYLTADVVSKPIETVEVTISSGSIADIRTAISNIQDASYYKRYVLKITGTYYASLPSDYEFNAGLASYALFWLKDYVSIDGTDYRLCEFRADLPDSLAACQADKPGFVKANYGVYQPLFIRTKSNIKNCTFICRNVRYPLHIDGGSSDVLANAENIIENCVLSHGGKHGDAEGTTGGSASGFGLNSGQKIVLKDCTLISDYGLYIHDNDNLATKPEIRFENCVVKSRTRSIIAGFQVQSLNNIKGMNCYVLNTHFSSFPWLAMDSRSNVNDRADSEKTRIITDLVAMPIYSQTTPVALRLRTVAESGSSIRYNMNASSFFDAVVGQKNSKTYYEFNDYGREQVNGCMYRSGGVGLKAEAIGTIDATNLGALLGDCTVTQKVLSVDINGTNYVFTFTNNYTTMSNDDIIAEINTKLNGLATADLYKINREFFPEFRGVEFTTVEDSSAVLVGMGVVFTTNGVRRAKSTDGYIDGIAVDSGANGSYIRIITEGGMAYKDEHFSIYQTQNKAIAQMPAGTLLGISSDNDGEFTDDTTKYTIPVLRCGFYAAPYIIK